ncbi:phage/plasmid primase, P4 family [Methylocella sp.]|uniref:phage/plasmid primase, P4 family n=1 Tax=Methylocella sp. TaxID=1978226 RepID=UPI003C1BCF72
MGEFDADKTLAQILELKPRPKVASTDLVTEDSAALEFARRFDGKLRYDHDASKWFEFDGNVWRLNKTCLAFHWARELARELAQAEADKIRYVSSKVSFASGVERFSRADRAFAVTSEMWDLDHFLLGTPDGTVDLRTGRLRQSNPDDGITKSTAVSPADAADCRQWLRFLDETTRGDAELIRFLQQFFGYSLTGNTMEHALLFGHGGGGNGKGVTLTTVGGILGDYHVTASMDMFIASAHDRHPTDLAMLRGARLVTASETEKGRAWAETRIKSLTGGDPVTARFMNRDFFTYQPTFKLFIVGNDSPALSSVDDAARRRFNIVGFTNKPEKPDLELGDKLRAEWPSILRWMIDGCLDWQRNRLVRPKSVIAATSDYFTAQDMLGQWLDERCDCEPGNTYKTATSGEAFSDWVSYAKAAGEPPSSQKAFAENLTKRGFTKSRGHGGKRMFVGVRLKTPQNSNL